MSYTAAPCEIRSFGVTSANADEYRHTMRVVRTPALIVAPQRPTYPQGSPIRLLNGRNRHLRFSRDAETSRAHVVARPSLIVSPHPFMPLGMSAPRILLAVKHHELRVIGKVAALGLDVNPVRIHAIALAEPHLIGT